MDTLDRWPDKTVEKGRVHALVGGPWETKGGPVAGEAPDIPALGPLVLPPIAGPGLIRRAREADDVKSISSGSSSSSSSPRGAAATPVPATPSRAGSTPLAAPGSSPPSGGARPSSPVEMSIASPRGLKHPASPEPMTPFQWKRVREGAWSLLDPGSEGRPPAAVAKRSGDGPSTSFEATRVRHADGTRP